MAARGSIDILIGVKGGTDISAAGSSGKNIADALNSIEKKLKPINIKFAVDETAKKKLSDSAKEIMQAIREASDISSYSKSFKDGMGTLTASLHEFAKDVEKQCSTISEKLSGALNLGNSLTLNATIDPEQFKSLRASMAGLASSVSSLRKVLGEVDGVSEVVAKNAEEAANAAKEAVESAQAVTDATQEKTGVKKTTTKKSPAASTTKVEAADQPKKTDKYSSLVQSVTKNAPADAAQIDVVNAAIIKLGDSMDQLLQSLETIAKFDLSNIVIKNVAQDAAATTEATSGAVAAVQGADTVVKNSSSDFEQFTLILGALSKAMEDISKVGKHIDTALGFKNSKDANSLKTLKEYLDAIIADLVTISEKKVSVEVTNQPSAQAPMESYAAVLQDIISKFDSLLAVLPATREDLLNVFSSNVTSGVDNLATALDKVIVSGKQYINVAKDIANLELAPNKYAYAYAGLSDEDYQYVNDAYRFDNNYRKRPGRLYENQVHFSDHFKDDFQDRPISRAQAESSYLRGEAMLGYLLEHFNVGDLKNDILIGDSAGLAEYFEQLVNLLSNNGESAQLIHVATELAEVLLRDSKANGEQNEFKRATTYSSQGIFPPVISIGGAVRSTTWQEDLHLRDSEQAYDVEPYGVFKNSVEGAIIHEFGHVIHNLLDEKIVQELDSFYGELGGESGIGKISSEINSLLLQYTKDGAAIIDLFDNADFVSQLMSSLDSIGINFAEKFPALFLNSWTAAMSQSLRDGSMSPDSFFDNTLSTYAATNKREFFAEAFADMFTNIPSDIANQFGHLLANAFGQEFTDLPLPGFNNQNTDSSGQAGIQSGQAINVHIDSSSIDDISNVIHSALNEFSNMDSDAQVHEGQFGDDDQDQGYYNDGDDLGDVDQQYGVSFDSLQQSIELLTATLSSMQDRIASAPVDQDGDSGEASIASETHDSSLTLVVEEIRDFLTTYLTAKSSTEILEVHDATLIERMQNIADSLSAFLANLESAPEQGAEDQASEYLVKDSEAISTAIAIRDEVVSIRAFLENGLRLSTPTNLDTVYNYLSSILLAIGNIGIQRAIQVFDRDAIAELKRIKSVTPKGGGGGTPNTRQQQEINSKVSSYRSLVTNAERLQAQKDALQQSGGDPRIIVEMEGSILRLRNEAAQLRSEIEKAFSGKSQVKALKRWQAKLDNILTTAIEAAKITKEQLNVKEAKSTVKTEERTQKQNDTKQKAMSAWMEKAMADIDGLQSSAVDLMRTLPGLSYNITDDMRSNGDVAQATQYLREYIDAYNAIQLDPKTQLPIVSDANIEQFEKAQAAAAKYRAEIKRLNSEFTTNMKLSDIANQAEAEYERYKRTISSNDEINQRWQNFFVNVRNGFYKTAAEAKVVFDQLEADTRKVGGFAENFLQKFSRIFSGKLLYGAIGKLAQRARRLLPEMYQYIVQIDDAMSQFAIVTNASESELNKFGEQAFKIAKDTATNVTDVINAATVYSRLGFTGDESLQYSELTTMYSKVGAVDVSAAEDAITAMIKAFSLGTDDLENALDKMIAVGNNAPISASQLGEGFNNAAAALAAAGNSMEQSIGMLTAANATLQDVSKASTALRTITARIRNSTAELEELGESTDGLATSTAKYRQQVLALSGVDIMVDNDIFKSTFDILDELAEKWENLSDINKSSLTTLLAGTRQQAVFASLMQNWDEARHAVELCNDAGGSLATAYEKYTETINAQIQKLKSNLAELANTLVESGTIASIVKFGSGIVNVINAIVTGLNKIGGILPIIVGLLTGAVSTALPGILSSIKGLIRDVPVLFGFIQTDGLLGALSGLNMIPTAAGLAVTAITAIITASIKARKQLEADIAESANSAKELSDNLMSLYSEYVQLDLEVSNGNASREDLLSVQKKIIDATGQETDAVDRLIYSYGHLSAISKTVADQLRENTPALYANVSSKKAAVLRKSDWKSWFIPSSKKITDEELNIAGLYRNQSVGLSLGLEGALSRGDIDGVIEAYGRLENSITRLSNAGYVESKLYKKLTGLRDYFKDAVDEYTDSIKEYNKTVVSQTMLNELQQNGIPDTVAEYKNLRGALIDNILSMQQSENPTERFIGSLTDIKVVVDEILSQQDAFKDFVSVGASTGYQLASVFNFKDFSEAVSELSGSLQKIRDIQNEMDSEHKLSLESINTLMDILNAKNLDYTDYLYEENGVIKANADALKQMAASSLFSNIENAQDAYKSALAMQESPDTKARLAALQAKRNAWSASDIGEYNTIVDIDQIVEDAKTDYELAISIYKLFVGQFNDLTTKTKWERIDTASDKISTLGSAFEEFASDGKIAYSTIDNIRTLFSDYDGIGGIVERLASQDLDSNSLSSIFNSLIGDALSNTYSYDELINESPAVLSAWLKEAGVANADSVAIEAINSAKERYVKLSEYAAKFANASTDKERQDILDTADAYHLSAQDLYQFVMLKQTSTDNQIDTEQEVVALEAFGRQAGLAGDALGYLAQMREAFDKAQAFDVGSSEYEMYMGEVQMYRDLLHDSLDAQSTKTFLNFDLNGINAISESYSRLNDELQHNIDLLEHRYSVAERTGNYDVMRESLAEELKYYKQQRSNLMAELDKIANQTGQDAKDMRRSIESELIQIDDAITSVMEKSANAVSQMLSSRLDDVQSAWTSLSSAAKEFSENGYLSVDSFQAIAAAGVEYVAMLKDENGQLQLNEEGIARVLEAKTQELAVQTAMDYVTEVENALINNQATELERLLNATTATTSSTWDLVYARAALIKTEQGMTNSQYNQLIANLDKFRSLANTTISGIRKEISSTIDDSSIDYKSALDKILSLTEEMIKHEHDEMKEVLEEERDAYQDIINKKKELLESTKDEQDYEREVAKKLQEIAKIQKQINLLNLDDSREALAKRTGLETELADLQDELNSYISDKSLEANQELLDKEAEQYSEYIDEKIKAVEEEVSSTEKLYKLATERINSNWSSLYSDLIAYNTEFGNSINSEVVSAWDAATEAIQRYGSFASALEATKNGTSLGSSSGSSYASGETSTIGGGTSGSFDQNLYSFGNAVMNQAKGHNVYSTTNNQAQPGDLVITNGGVYRKLDGGKSELAIATEHYPYNYGINNKSAELYELLKKGGYIYHSGGIVGKSNRKQDEELAILQDGELVATEKMQDRLFSMVDFVDSVSKKLKALPYANGITSLLSNNVVSGLQALKAPVAASTNNSMVFENHIEVTINHNGDMTDGDLRGYGEKIADATLGKLAEAFQKRGVRNISSAMLRG